MQLPQPCRSRDEILAHLNRLTKDASELWRQTAEMETRRERLANEMASLRKQLATDAAASIPGADVVALRHERRLLAPRSSRAA
jgi:hypothetical protein